MATSDAIWTMIITHLETQMKTITGVSEFEIINPARGQSTKNDWLGFGYLLSTQTPRYAIAQDLYPTMILTVRVGIVVSDSKKDEHENQVALARCRLGDWYDTWFSTNGWYTDLNPHADSVGSVSKSQGAVQIANNINQSTMVYIDIPFSINRS